MKPLRFFKGIHLKFIIILLLVIMLAVQVFGAYFNRALETHLVNNFTRMLDQQAHLLAYSIQHELETPFDETDGPENYEHMQSLIDKMFASIPHAEIQVLDRNGVVVSTNSDNQAIVGQRNTQIEVKRALLGTRDEAIRLHPQTGHRMKMMSIPIKVNNEVVGAIYLMASMEETYQSIQDINGLLLRGTLIALSLTAVIGVVVARTITSPIKEMTRQTQAMAAGDFSKQVKVYSEDEIGQLAQGINHLSQRLSQALGEIEEEKNKLASILFYMSDGLIATDRQGRIILLNQQAEMMLNKREREVLGKKLSEVLDFPDEVKQDTLLFKEGRFQVDMGADGQPLIIEITVSPLHQDGAGQGLIAVLQDVTEREQLERDRKAFVANVSHELRTPLTTMKSYVETLTSGAVDDPDVAKRFLNVIANETERMIRLVNDLLQLSKLDSKRFRLRLKKLDLGILVEEVIQRFSFQLKERSLTVRLDIDPDLPSIEGDQDMLTQVLDNILSNAIKYSLAGGEIAVLARQEGEQVKLVIKDQGVGIPKQELKHIFKRFYRVDKARSRDKGGVGLGLSITREMVLAHQGSIEIDSDVGEGTAVTIRLPLQLSVREGTS
ncbi:two-component system sensor histidine kinase VicK [Caldalkalibacillus uzonensis]|uniref:histidine kinase n=1 Tax=Caldalkalibacillus uzonensis TaxID=353224 RepID=A0ABU0CSB0_9BACI|nr:cell wall metabolism sensor histidine kinase WalK [Caldalkalibacillus uzonensis]MDQ0339307.1 two-component system sensor histidine kinase VicK [Caldalkalibacillus uzonensis]